MLSLPVALSASVLGQSLPWCSEKREHCPVLALTRSHCTHSCLFTCLSLTCVLLVFGPSTWPGQDKALQQCLGSECLGKSEWFTIYQSYKTGKGLVTRPGELSQRRGILCCHFRRTIWMQSKTITVWCDLFFKMLFFRVWVFCKLAWRDVGVEERQMRVKPAPYRFSHGPLLFHHDAWGRGSH